MNRKKPERKPSSDPDRAKRFGDSGNDISMEAVRPEPQKEKAMHTYDIHDPQGVHESQTVKAGDPDEAKRPALALMYGCPLDEVDERHIRDSLKPLRVVEHN